MLKENGPMRPGRWLRVNPSFANLIRPLETSDPTASTINFLEFLRSLAYEIASTTPVSAGLTLSGRSKAMIDEDEDKTFTFQIADAEEGWGVVGQHALTVAKRMYMKPKQITILGRASRAEHSVFDPAEQGAKIRDVYVQPRGILPDNKVAALEVSQDVAALLPPNPETGAPDTGLILEVMQFPLPNIDEAIIDRTNARQENGRLLRGENVMVSPMDNHKAHYREHRLEATLYQNETPEHKVIIQHAMIHQQQDMMQMQMAVAMSSQQIAGGQPAVEAGVAGMPAQPGAVVGMPPDQQPAAQRVHQADVKGEQKAKAAVSTKAPV